MGKSFNYKRNVSLEERFWSKVDKTNTDTCWEWQASLDTRGYGNFGMPREGFPGKFVMQRAHRIAWYLTHGYLLTSEQYLCHTCDNRKCVNPQHLFIGDAKINALDCASKQRFPYRKGVNNARARLTETNVKEIRASNDSLAVLAAKYKVGKTTIAYVKNGLSWAHIL